MGKPLAKGHQRSNNLPNEEYLEGVAPTDVKDNDELMFSLLKKNARYLALNQRNMMQRATKPKEAGAFRATIATSKFQRGHRPRFETTTREVNDIQGARVVDTDGNRFFD